MVNLIVQKIVAFFTVILLCFLFLSREIREPTFGNPTTPSHSKKSLGFGSAGAYFENIGQFFRLLESQYVDPGRLDPVHVLWAGLLSLEGRFSDFEVYKNPLSRFEKIRNVALPSLCMEKDKTLFCEAPSLDTLDFSRTKILDKMIFRIRNRIFEVELSSNWRGLKSAEEITKSLFSEMAGDTSLNHQEFIKEYLNGILSQLDPHSRYLSQTEYRDLKSGTRGNFGGVGVVLDEIALLPTIREVVPNSPAQLAGIKAEDILVKIQDKIVVFEPVNDVLTKIREVDTRQVTVAWVFRPSTQRLFSAQLFRDEIPTRSVERRLIPDRPDILFLKISGFNSKTSEELLDIYDSAQAHARTPFQYLIIDLRGNPGGLLDQAIQTADLFIEKGMLLQTRGKLEETMEASIAGRKISEPLMVIQNSSSASASEILAGALKDHNRAIVVGERSFGKGNVQSVYELSGGSALKLTVAHYYTPSGTSLQGRGIDPHFLVRLVQKRGDHLWMFGSSELEREEDLFYALQNPNAIEGANQSKGDPTTHEVWSLLESKNPLMGQMEEYNFSYPNYEAKDAQIELDSDRFSKIAVVIGDQWKKTGFESLPSFLQNKEIVNLIQSTEMININNVFKKVSENHYSSNLVSKIGHSGFLSRWLSGPFGLKFSAKNQDSIGPINEEESKWRVLNQLALINKGKSENVLICCEDKSYKFRLTKKRGGVPSGLVSISMNKTNNLSTFWTGVVWKKLDGVGTQWEGTIQIPPSFWTYMSLATESLERSNSGGQPVFVRFQFVEGFGKPELELGRLLYPSLQSRYQEDSMGSKGLLKVQLKADPGKEMETYEMTLQYYSKNNTSLSESKNLTSHSDIFYQLIPVMEKSVEVKIRDTKLKFKEKRPGYYEAKERVEMTNGQKELGNFSGVLGIVVTTKANQLLLTKAIAQVADGKIELLEQSVSPLASP